MWVEKYKPKGINDVIFDDEQRKNVFQKMIDNGDILNLLLSGNQGTGKSTLSRILVKELKVPREDILKIACSDRQIEAIRDDVSHFSMTLPTGNFKIVRLEEIDKLSKGAQGLLRTVIDDAQTNCRFIATCNWDNMLTGPLKSRFSHFIFKEPSLEGVIEKMMNILIQEKIEFKDEDLINVINLHYPDIRATIIALETFSITGKLIPSFSKSTFDWKDILLTLVKEKKWNQVRKLICEEVSREDHENVYRLIYENAENIWSGNSVDKAILIIAEHLYNHSMVADTEINLAAAFIKLSQL